MVSCRYTHGLFLGGGELDGNSASPCSKLDEPVLRILCTLEHCKRAAKISGLLSFSIARGCMGSGRKEEFANLY